MASCWIFFTDDRILVVEVSSPKGEPWGHPGNCRIEVSVDFTTEDMAAAVREAWECSTTESDLDDKEKRMEAHRSVGDAFGVERVPEGWGRLFDDVKFVQANHLDGTRSQVIAVTATKPVRGGGGRDWKDPRPRLPLDASDLELVDAIREAMQYTW